MVIIMKNLFRLDSPMMLFLSRVTDLIIVNLLFWLCCLPVITIGASLAALHKVTQSMVLDEDGGVVKPFFRAFRDNFKQATLGWLVLVAFLAGLGVDLMLSLSYLTGNTLTVCKWMIAILACIILAISEYYFQLIVRYENTVRQHLTNAAILALVKLPRTIVMIFLTLLPLLIALVSMNVFVSTMIFWVILGFAFVSFIQSSLLRPVFRQLEKPEGPNVQLMD